MPTFGGSRSKQRIETHYNPDKPNLFNKCSIDDLNFTLARSLSDFDKFLLDGTLILQFRVYNIENDSTVIVRFNQVKQLDNIIYMLERKSIIAKRFYDRYKTVRGLIEAMYSATRDGRALASGTVPEPTVLDMVRGGSTVSKAFFSASLSDGNN